MAHRSFAWIGLLAWLGSAQAMAATLAADTLLCESATTLEYVDSRAELKGRPGSVVMKQAQAALDLYKMQRPGLDTLGTVPRERTTPSGEDGTIAIASYCVVTDARSSATVVEQRATRGLVKVQTVYQGRRVERWAFSSALGD